MKIFTTHLRSKSVGLVTLVYACLCGSTAVHATAFGVRDLVQLRRVSDVAVSPDGKRVAYTLRITDMAANKGRTSIWVRELSQPEESARRVSEADVSSSAPEWSADGAAVYFLSSKGGSSQVWRVSVPTAATGAPGPTTATATATAPRQVTNLPLDVGTFRVSPAGGRLVVSLEIFPDCTDLACTRQRLETTEHAAAHGRVYDSLFARHWDTWSDGRRSTLFAITMNAQSIADGTPVNLMRGLSGDVPSKPFGGPEDYAISPDGREVAFSMRKATGEPWSTNFDIYRAPIDGGEPRDVTPQNLAADAQPRYSPDGKKLAYLAMDRAGFEADRYHLVLLDLGSGARSALTADWDRSINSYSWARNGRALIADADDGGQRPLWSIDVVSGHATALTGAGEVESFSVGPREILYSASSLSGPADLYSIRSGGGKPRRLTEINRDALADRTLGAYHAFNFPGWHGQTVHGYVVEPPGLHEGQKYPVALLVHGGPQGSMANLWHWRWNAQTFAGAGYGVVMIDFHGSTGYGQAFTDSISQDWGGKPVEDLKLGLTAAIQQVGWLDGEKVCALGGSYGGFMMNWILGQWPDRFKCIVTHDGIFDQRSMYYTTEELWFPEWENGGTEYQNPAAYAKFNPADHVSAWRTPTLVIHGELDYRVPYAQGLAVYTALQRRGIPSELLYFPDENHWVLKPANAVQWYDTVIAWMNRWTAN